jgi:ABC-type lipoprotein release transport system permease subunit
MQHALSKWNVARLALAGLRHHWRIHAAASLGVVVGAAVLSGALVVGDSVRFSLKRLTLERLGRVELALVSDRLFRTELADELAKHPEFPSAVAEVQPAILLRGSIDWLPSGPQAGRAPHAAGVTLIGVTPPFWELGEWPAPRPARGEIVINEPLASALAAELLEFQIELAEMRLTLRTPPGLPPWTEDQAAGLSLAGQPVRLVRVGQPGVILSNGRRPPSTSAGAAGPRGPGSPSTMVRMALGKDFWQLDAGQHPARLYLRGDAFELEWGKLRKQFRLNQTVAADWRGQRLAITVRRPRVEVGDDLVLRLPRPSDIPPDSPLGRKSGNIGSRRLRVAGIVPARGLGRFSLNPSQQAPRNAYVAMEELQQVLRRPGSPTTKVANCLLVAGRQADATLDVRTEAAIARALRPKLADYGLALAQSTRGYLQLTSDRMMLEPYVEEAALRALAPWKPQPVLTYLANYIMAGPKGKAKIPYSTVAALVPSSAPPLGPLVLANGQPVDSLANGEVLLNRWAAEDLAAQGVPVELGSEITFTYFEPESTHGEVRERSVQLRLAGIVELSGAAADPDLTPELRGVTDEASIRDWDPPFPYDPDRVRTIPPHDQDERYWDEYRATPKAFVSLEQGRRLWASRFGQATAVRCERTVSVEQARAALERALDPRQLGFVFQPLKRQGLAASAGTTSFGMLFIGFSMFLILAATLLVGLLFRLGVERRSREVGVLLAVGWTRGRVARLLLAEGTLAALAGSIAGALLGLGYAWLMLAGLRTWWLAAIREPFLQLHATPLSLVVGGAAGALAALAAILWAVRSTQLLSLRQLMAGQFGPTHVSAARASRRWRAVALAALAAGVGLAIWGRGLEAQTQAAAFMGAGTLVLLAAIGWLWGTVRAAPVGGHIFLGRCQLVRLALRNVRRHPGRTALSLGLMASACFLIVSLAAFHLDPEVVGRGRASGTGGYALVAEATVPIYRDLCSPDAADWEGLAASEMRELEGIRCLPFRVQAGDDASCLNLYQPTQPRVLGAPREFRRQGGFRWRASQSPQTENPWLLLETGEGPAADDGPIPAVLDQNTATYSLHLSGVGSRFEMPGPRGEQLQFVVVGLLQDSIFQGDVIISEEAFRRVFPQVSGARFFLIDAPQQRAAQVASVLERALAEEGLEVQAATERLAGFLAVQNTYLSTFQTLGGLGLLLGTLGLAVVQLRSVVERRGELALLRATGFATRLLARLVFWEHAALLVGGLAMGVAAALVAVLPQIAAGGADLPWPNLSITLSLVLAVGLCAGLAGVFAVARAPLLAALREET